MSVELVVKEIEDNRDVEKEMDDKLSIGEKELDDKLSIGEKELDDKLSIGEKELDDKLSIGEKELDDKQNNGEICDTDDTGSKFVKASKNQRRKLKKKQSKAKRRQLQAEKQPEDEDENPDNSRLLSDDIEVEYIEDVVDLKLSDPCYFEFAKVFEAFKLSGTNADKSQPDDVSGPKIDLRKIPKDFDDVIDVDIEKKDDATKISNRKLKKLGRLTVADLKQQVARPDVIEMHDVTARDPKLLIALKSTRNTVPVPRHWCYKRKYLQGKRGIEKPPFNLPDCIKRTGIMELRQSVQEKDDQKSLKSRMKEKVRPKMGKIDMDYQKLHDAFFRWQTKPIMTGHGELYYEGKEYESRHAAKRPGEMSDELKCGLGMPVGHNSDKTPPPWLIMMQRYGPPPSFPNLKVPGLNKKIPDGCAYGYHAGGWGKPPVDEAGHPLYGDVFGDCEFECPEDDEQVDRTLWGGMESDAEAEMESEDDEDEKEDKDEEIDNSGLMTPAGGDPHNSSFLEGLDTPDAIELRKRKIESEIEKADVDPLYVVLPEKKSVRDGGAMLASTHVYDLSAAGSGSGGIAVALDPSELDDAAALSAKYERAVSEQQSHLVKADFSDMVAEHVAKQSSKRKRQDTTQKGAKKYKEFKF